MAKKIFVILLIVVLVTAIGVMTLSAKERVLHIDQTLTGTYRALDLSHGLFDVTLQGSPGPATGQGLSFSGPPLEKGDLPEGNICDDIPENPDGVPLVAPTATNLIFSDGSMLFSRGANGSYLCFSGFVLAKYEIVGGTDRFEGATGYWEAEIYTYPIGGQAVVAESGSVTGEIWLP